MKVSSTTHQEKAGRPVLMAIAENHTDLLDINEESTKDCLGVTPKIGYLM